MDSTQVLQDQASQTLCRCESESKLDEIMIIALNTGLGAGLSEHYFHILELGYEIPIRSNDSEDLSTI